MKLEKTYKITYQLHSLTGDTPCDSEYFTINETIILDEMPTDETLKEIFYSSQLKILPLETLEWKEDKKSWYGEEITFSKLVSFKLIDVKLI